MNEEIIMAVGKKVALQRNEHRIRLMMKTESGWRGRKHRVFASFQNYFKRDSVWYLMTFHWVPIM